MAHVTRAPPAAEREARACCWFVDSRGLVVKARGDLPQHKRPYAHDVPFTADFLEVVKSLRPAALVGVSGAPATFTQPVVAAMTACNERPIIFALSNPTAKAECTAEQAYTWTNGRAVFASGSAFDPVSFGGKTFVPGQGNNAYIFPGVGLGVIATESKRTTDEMFLAAARALAGEVSEADLGMGRIYPALSRIREVSVTIAVAVAEIAYACQLARVPRGPDLQAQVRAQVFDPTYKSLV